MEEHDLDYYLGLPYRMEIVPDKEEGGYALLCPELPGCITCAETIQEGLQLLEDAKREWINARLEDGEPIPEVMRQDDFSGQFQFG